MNLTTRKTAFKQDILEHIRLIPGGSKGYQRYMQRTALSLINDLARLGVLPIKLKYLRPEKIASLVYLWRNEKLSPKTIANRLSVLRAIAMTERELLYIVPDNQTLNIKPKETIKTLIHPTLKLDPHQIQNSDIQRICLLQYLFGLKKMEAIRSFGLLIKNDVLMIPRLISFNKKERHIPIETDAQIKLLENLHLNPLTPCLKALSLLHHHELKKHHLLETEYFRQLYIVNRYQELSLRASQKEALKHIQLETGYHSLRQIKGVLLCLEDF